MTRAQVLLVAVLAIPLAGCVLGGKPKTVAAAPAPPKPAVPAPPPEPLSIPQTQVELPAPQTFNQDALNTAPQEETRPQAQTKPATQAPKPRAPAPQPRTTDAQPPVPEPAAEQPTEPARAPILEIMPDAEKNRLRDEAHGHQEETRKLLREAKPKTANQKRAQEEINQFLKQSQEAENAGDMRMADQLAERAHILAKELESGK
jgi:hypothetical protein